VQLPRESANPRDSHGLARRFAKAMQAMMGMKKLDIAELERAAQG
jgi:predicted 3-demethylubiquinone-9 3-methyltransferase (glyoxalase superfamily)